MMGTRPAARTSFVPGEAPTRPHGHERLAALRGRTPPLQHLPVHRTDPGSLYIGCGPSTCVRGAGGQRRVRYETNITDSLRLAPSLCEIPSIGSGRGPAGFISCEAMPRTCLINGEGALRSASMTSLAGSSRPSGGSIRHDPLKNHLVSILKWDDRSGTAADDQALSKDLHVSSNKHPLNFWRAVERSMLDYPLISPLIRSMRDAMEMDLVPALR